MKKQKTERKMTLKERREISPFLSKGRIINNIGMLKEFQKKCIDRKIKIEEARLTEDINEPNYLIIKVKSEKILILSIVGNLNKSQYDYIGEELYEYRKKGKMPYMYDTVNFKTILILVAGTVGYLLPRDYQRDSQIKEEYGSKIVAGVITIYIFKHIYDESAVEEIVEKLPDVLKID